MPLKDPTQRRAYDRLLSRRPRIETPEQLFSRFMSHVTQTPSCWVWKGKKDRYGYGQIKTDRLLETAHRVAWRLFRYDTSLHVLHRCDNPSCVNPEHLFVGTHSDNMHDAAIKGRTARGERNGSATLSAADVLRIRGYLRDGWAQISLAKMYRVDPSTISHIATGKAWRWIE